MRRILLILLFALLAPLAARANSNARGWCESGNIPVITSGLTSTNVVQGSFPQCTITVLIHGGGLATIYSDNSNTPLANPFLAQTNGQWLWYAADGRYDVTMTCVAPCVPPTPSPFPITYSDIVLATGGGGGGGFLSGSIANTQIAFGTATNTLGGSANLTYTLANGTITSKVTGSLPFNLLMSNNAAPSVTHGFLTSSAGVGSWRDSAGDFCSLNAPSFDVTCGDASGNNSLLINSAGTQLLTDGAIVQAFGLSAGQGLALGAGNFTGTAAPQISATWINTNAGSIFPGFTIAATDAASAAGTQIFQVFGGAAGTTNLFKVGKAGDVVASGSLSAPIINDTGITGSTQCLQANSAGTLSGTGATCGASWATDILSEAKPAYGTTKGSSGKGISVLNNATATILNLTSQSPGGYVSAMWIGVGAQDNASLLTITADGNTVFNDRACLFFGAEYQSNQGSFMTRFIGASNNNSNNVGFLSHIPIPFTNSISIVFTNETGGTINIWYTISYQTGIANTWPRTQKLVARSGTIAAATPGQVLTLVSDAGLNPGRFLGMAFSVDSVPGSANPLTAPLEGEFKFYFDGNVGAPDYFSSGTEDYVGMSNYFQGFDITRFAAAINGIQSGLSDYSGLTVKSTSGTWNAYRFHILDPFMFQSGLRITWDAGETGVISWTGTVRFSYCLWYYTT